MRITVYPSALRAASEDARPFDLDPADLISDPPDVRAEKDGPCAVLGEIAAGERRSKAALVAVHAVGLDFDDVGEEQLAAALAPDALGRFEHVAWTTFSHGAVAAAQGAAGAAAQGAAGAARLRVVFPLASPVGPARAEAAWRALAREAADAGAAPDPRAADASRLHYLPAIRAADAPFEAWHSPGPRFEAPEPDALEAEAPAEIPAAEIGLRADGLRLWLSSRAGALGLVRSAARSAARGEPFAQPGERHEAILRLTLAIATAFRSTGRSVSDLPEPWSVVERVLRPSLVAMQSEGQRSGGDLVEEARRAYEGASLFANKPRQSLELPTPRVPEGVDLDTIARTQGCTVDDLARRWLVAQRDSLWLLNPRTGSYVGPFGGLSLDAATRRILAGAPVRLQRRNGKGAIVERSARDLLGEHGTVILDVIDDLAAQTSRLENGRLVIAPCPRRPLAPRFDPDVARWLDLVGGPQREKLLDWLAVAPDLDTLLCAIYFEGVPGTGKTLLAHGLARIWSDAPTSWEDFDGSFNEAVLRCPIVFADEEVSRSMRRQSATSLIREMLTTQVRALRVKYRAPSTLRGAVRLILAGNSDTLLSWRAAASADDLAALAQRILYLRPPREAAAHLVDVGRERIDRDWLAGGAIAAHVLHLRETRAVDRKRPGRFVVEGDVSHLHRMLLTGSPVNSGVVEVLVKHLLSPSYLERDQRAPVVRLDGGLWANVEAIRAGWQHHLRTKEDPPSTAQVGRALRTIADDEEVRRFTHEGRRVRFMRVDTDHLIEWAEHHGVASRDEIEASLAPSAGGERGIVVELPRRAPDDDETQAWSDPV